VDTPLPNSIPHSREAEEALIGSVLIDPIQYRMVNVDADDFYIHRNKWIWESFGTLVDRDIDFITVSDVLEQAGKLGEVGGPAYLTSLLNSVPTAMHAQSYADIITFQAEQRRHLITANELAKQAYSKDGVKVSGIVRQLTGDIHVTGGAVVVKEIIGEPEEYLKKLQEDDRIPSPWDRFNRIAGGVARTQSTLLVGKPGVGKSVFIGAYGLKAAMDGFQVDIYEVEMTENDLIVRWVSDLAGVATEKIKYDDVLMTQEEEDRVLRKLAYINTLNIRIASGVWSSAAIVADLMKKSYEKPSDLVIIDSLGQLRENDENKWDKVETSSLTLKQAALENNFALLCVATMVKSGSIRGTREVEHICDYWYSFEKPEGAVKPDDPGWFTREIYPGKQRHGGKASFCELRMASDLPRLKEVTNQESPDRHYDK